MKALICGLAASSLFLSAGATAQAAELSNGELDQVTAGFFELDTSNTSSTAISIWQVAYFGDPSPNTIHCSSCYLLIVSPTFSIGSSFGALTPPPSGPPEG